MPGNICSQIIQFSLLLLVIINMPTSSTVNCRINWITILIGLDTLELCDTVTFGYCSYLSNKIINFYGFWCGISVMTNGPIVREGLNYLDSYRFWFRKPIVQIIYYMRRGWLIRLAVTGFLNQYNQVKLSYPNSK